LQLAACKGMALGHRRAQPQLRNEAGVQPFALRLDQVRRPQGMARAQADQSAVLVGRQPCMRHTWLEPSARYQRPHRWHCARCSSMSTGSAPRAG
jgi:hypothetical protein